MADKERWNLDSNDFGPLEGDLLKDLQQATKQVQQQKAKDKAQKIKSQTSAQDKGKMYAIVAVAAVVIFALAYWNTFIKTSAPEPPPPSQKAVTQPNSVPQTQAVPAAPNQPYRQAPNYAQPRPVQPTYPTVPRPAPQTAPSEGYSSSNSEENPDEVGM